MTISLEQLVSDAGLDASLADALRKEEVTVEVLLKSSLSERREVLRAMNQSFGALLALNRVLEACKRGMVADEEEEEEEDDDDEEEETTAHVDVSEQLHVQEYAGAVPSVVAPTGAMPTAIKEASPQLRAAAMLLRGAEPHTLRALQAYLGNVLSHPRKQSYRTIQLANPLFHERVWGVPGGASVLRSAGFQENQLPGNRAALCLATSAPLAPVAAAKRLVDELISYGQPVDAEPASPAPTAYFASPKKAAATRPSPMTSLVPSAAGDSTSVRDPEAERAARETLHRRAADSVVSVAGLLDDAHTRSWDAALSSSSSVRVETLSAREIRCCRKCNQGRLVALLGRLTKRLWELGSASEATLEQSATCRRYLSTLLILTRLMPLLLENAEERGVQHMLWSVLPAPPAPEAEEAAKSASPAVRRHLHTVGGSVLHGVLMALFARGFTVVGGADAQRDADTDSAAGSNLWATSSAAFDEARIVAMRALLACCSATLYVPGTSLEQIPNRMLVAAVGAPDPHGKALFRALVSVIFSYDPVGWGIPYAGSLIGDSHAEVMATASQLLLVLLSQPVGSAPSSAAQPAAASPMPPSPAETASAPGPSAAPSPSVLSPGSSSTPSPVASKLLDRVSRFLGGLQRPETLAFLVQGFERLLHSRYASESSYLPSSTKPVECEQELVLLLWLALSLNGNLVAALVADGMLPNLIASLCHLIFAWGGDLACASAVHLCILSMLTLSAEPEFASTVNQPCPRGIPLTGIAAAASAGSVGDLILGAVAYLILPQPDGVAEPRLRSVYPGALALLANIAPHVKQWASQCVGLLPRMLAALAAPPVLLADAGGAEHLIALLEAISLSLQYTHHSNYSLLHVLLLNAPLLQSIPDLALETAHPSEGVPDAFNGSGSENEPPFEPTAEWAASVRARLPMKPILAALATLSPRVKREQLQLDLDQLPAALKKISLTAALPPPPPICMRRYQPNEHSHIWMTQVIWGLVYSRNQDLFDARAVRLVQILQVEE